MYWVRDNFKTWKLDGYPTSTAIHTVSLASNTGNTTATQGESTRSVVVSATKGADDALISWRRGRMDSTQYPIFDNDDECTEWINKNRASVHKR